MVMALGKRGVESMHLKARQAPKERNRLKIQHIRIFGEVRSPHTHTLVPRRKGDLISAP